MPSAGCTVSETIQIIRWLHPRDSQWRGTAVLKGFFDDSGTHEGSKVVAIGGCVAREEQWAQFEPEWAEMLAHFGIQEYHSGDLQAFAGEFKGWTEEKRRQLVGWAAKIGQQWAKHSFSSLLIREDYEQVVPEWAKQSAAFGDEYNFCFQMTVGQVMSWIEYLKPPMPDTDQIAFVFDQQPKKEGLTRFSYDQIKKFRDPYDRMGGFGFVSGKRFLPLQFADFIAYESYKELDRQLSGAGRSIRAPLRMLVENAYPLEPRFFDRRGLEALVASYDKRGRPEYGADPWWPWIWPGESQNSK